MHVINWVRFFLKYSSRRIVLWEFHSSSSGAFVAGLLRVGMALHSLADIGCGVVEERRIEKGSAVSSKKSCVSFHRKSCKGAI